MASKSVFSVFVLSLLCLADSSVATTWTGTVSSAWGKNSNWSPSEPTAGDDAYIPAVTTAPVITASGEVAYRVYINGPMSMDSGTLTVGERIVVGSGGAGTLTMNGGTITVTGSRLAMGDGADGTLNMNDGLIDVQGSSGIKNPDGSDTTVINLNGGTIQCTYLEAKASGSLVFNAGPGYPHGGLLIADGDHTQTSGGGYTHTFIGQMILDGWITTTIPGDIVICEYDTPAYPGKTVVMSVPNPVVIQFDSSSSGALESVSPAEISVSLSLAADHNVTVDYNVTGGTAEGSGVDYTLLGSGTLTFDPCQTTETISISIVNDGEDEENETIILTLYDPNGAELGDINEHTYTIIDPRPDVQFDSPGRAGLEDNISVTIPVSLSHTWNETVSVEYQVTGGTATGSGEDYVLSDGTLMFDPCEITLDINVTLVDDACQEGAETIELLLSEPNNAKLGDYAQLTFTIIDDEAGSTYTNSLGMEFTMIMPGTFQMGSEGGEWDERPVHNVTIGGQFLAEVMEITADQYGQFDANYSGSDAATGMSWHDANAFAKWLSRREGVTYRLPTEAEWEYICRAGTTTSYSSGGSPPQPNTPNPWGLKNMHNSPREWVWDWHGEYSYEDQVDPVGPEQGLARVVRGGGLDDDDPYYFRSANRAGIGPGFGGGQHDIGFRLVLRELPTTATRRYAAPFVRQGIKQNTAVVLQAPNPSDPYFNQRPLLPIPPDNASREVIDAAGLHPSFRGHNHSPGLEVCPNGDVLMIIYTSYSEYEPGVSLMATRLRFGALVWDMPTPMFDFPGANDHAPLLWNDNGTLHFFWGCPRLEPENSNPYPFQWISSTDSGATWDEVKFPVFEGPIGGHSRQPINTALRDSNDTIYVSSDAVGGTSVLWVSENDGQTWYDPVGRTGGRHTTFVLLSGWRILGMGGKNTDIDGYMPKSISSDGGKSWIISSTPFSTLGGNQRPCVIRLASGNLFFCSDFQRQSDCYQPAGITQKGVLVALSDDEGETWLIKRIPTALLHESWACDGATLGYSVARQAPNGIIHVISTMNHPCQHFEMNEEWILDDEAGGDPPPDPCETGTVDQYQENYPGGATKVTWGAKICDDGRYLLHGTETWYYQDGTKQYEATYYNGNKIGDETYWDPNGIKVWTWDHNEANNTSVWTQYWPNGLKKTESSWEFGGMVADGNSYHWELCGQPTGAYVFAAGSYIGETDLPEPQTDIVADLTGDCSVDAGDLDELAGEWLNTGQVIYPAAPNDTYLLLHYDFNEASGSLAADSSGNGNVGTLYNMTDDDWVTGQLGNALEFDGVDDYVYRSALTTTVTGDMALSCWINMTLANDGRRAVDLDAFQVRFDAEGRVGWDNGGGPSHETYSSDDIDDGLWHHVVFVRSGTGYQMYIDGQADSTDTGTVQSYDWIYVGRRSSGSYFAGKMDEIRIYDYALSHEEILTLAQVGSIYVPLNSTADLYDDGTINFRDYAIMASQWLMSAFE